MSICIFLSLTLSCIPALHEVLQGNAEIAIVMELKNFKQDRKISCDCEYFGGTWSILLMDTLAEGGREGDQEGEKEGEQEGER